jgi:hypothetical protein
MFGDISPDHIPTNKYQLMFLGVPPLTCTNISGLETELVTSEMPDRTIVSGGQQKATEFTIMIPEHHVVEQAAMEAWLIESTDPVLPSYKKVGTLLGISVSGNIIVSKQLVGVFPKKRTLPDREMINEGELSLVEWTLSVDQVFPLT